MPITRSFAGADSDDAFRECALEEIARVRAHLPANSRWDDAEIDRWDDAEIDRWDDAEIGRWLE
jgi:hypothetical protein